jgi:plastocyanin
MKKCVFSLLFAFFSLYAHAQLTITEIMYNPPESGEDSLEYIEFTNTSLAPLNLAGYKFTAGVVANFPSIILPAGKTIVISKDSVALKIVFKIDAYNWVSGSLSNGGEGITIVNAANEVVDEVTYDDVAPWPTDASGLGSSLVLCDVLKDNKDGANWTAAKNKTGVIINAIEIKASPNADNAISCSVAATEISLADFKFTPQDITINTGATVRWRNPSGHGHNVNGSKATFASNPEGFSSGAVSASNWVYEYTFTKEGKYSYQCDAHISTMKGTVTVVAAKVIPTYPIAKVTTVKADGVLDSLNVTCKLQGIVHGINVRTPTGLQFTIIDKDNHGIGVFNTSSSLGYTVKEGDEILIEGVVGQFNGLAQVTASKITLVASNVKTVSPKVITSIVESDESSLVQIKNLNYVSAAEWIGGPANTASFNVNVTDGKTTYVLRIDNDVDLAKLPAPKAPFNLTAIMGQFDSTSPFTEGYQFFPRYSADISSTSGFFDKVKSGPTFTIAPNPVFDQLKILSAVEVKSVDLYDMSGKFIARYYNNEMNVESLASGSYLVKVKFDNDTQSSATLIIP